MRYQVVKHWDVDRKVWRYVVQMVIGNHKYDLCEKRTERAARQAIDDMVAAEQDRLDHPDQVVYEVDIP